MEELIEYATHIIVCEECRHYDNTGCIDGIGICKRNGRVKEDREFCMYGEEKIELPPTYIDGYECARKGMEFDEQKPTSWKCGYDDYLREINERDWL